MRGFIEFHLINLIDASLTALSLTILGYFGEDCLWLSGGLFTQLFNAVGHTYVPHRPVLRLHKCYHSSSCGEASSMSQPRVQQLPAADVWSEPWLSTYCLSGSPAPLPRALAALFHQIAAVGNLVSPMWLDLHLPRWMSIRKKFLGIYTCIYTKKTLLYHPSKTNLK